MTFFFRERVKVWRDTGWRNNSGPSSGQATSVQGERVIRVAVRASHGDDDLSPSVPVLQIPDSVGSLAQRIRPVDGRCDLTGFDQFLHELQILGVLRRGDGPKSLAHER